MWRSSIFFGLLLIGAGCGKAVPEFRDAHAGEKVRLDLQWDRGACSGGQEKEEQPGIGICHGTEYNVPKHDGTWRLRGEFEPGERTGPLQGLFAVELQPAL